MTGPECNKNWFVDWFDSPYYHILYKYRNNCEAELFIDNLIKYLAPVSNAKFLDLACGKGRHSFYVNKKGYDVVGVDLSPENILQAQKLVQPNNIKPTNSLEFFVRDMRAINFSNEFDYVLNLFTSFGYFEDDAEDSKTIKAITDALKPNGILVLDFMNVKKVLSNLIQSEVKTNDEVTFTITKKIENNFIIKQIEFIDKGKKYSYTERVKILTQSHFSNYFAANNLKILDIKGNYELESFDENSSNRLIIIAQKA